MNHQPNSFCEELKVKAGPAGIAPVQNKVLLPAASARLVLG